MTFKSIQNILLAVLFMLGTLVFPAANPVRADHVADDLERGPICYNDSTYQCQHWDSRNIPSPVVYGANALSPLKYSITDAIRYSTISSDYGFWPVASAFSKPCDTVDRGEIRVCIAPADLPQLQGREGASGTLNDAAFGGPAGHIVAAIIWIKDDPALLGNAGRMLELMRHEFGHVMGLGHSADENSLMHTPISKNTYVNRDLAWLKDVLYNNHGLVVTTPISQTAARRPAPDWYHPYQSTHLVTVQRNRLRDEVLRFYYDDRKTIEGKDWPDYEWVDFTVPKGDGLWYSPTILRNWYASGWCTTWVHYCSDRPQRGMILGPEEYRGAQAGDMGRARTQVPAQ